MKEPQSPTKRFKDISADQLRKAVIEMVEKLGISGSAYGYSLYEACENERLKAIQAHNDYQESMKKEFPDLKE